MCGIAGVAGNQEEGIGLLLKKMLSAMQHRGPDGAGFAIGKTVQRKESFEDLDFEGTRAKTALGHVRLAITSSMSFAGVQPFQSQDGNIILLHNGEIYNYRELRSELSREFDFQTDSDSEVILKLLEKYYQGDLSRAMQKILPFLDGVYALAVTDQKKTVIARDRIGVRQLYYFNDRNRFFFASEKKPLIALHADPDDIKRLLPGHMAVIERNHFLVIPFWHPDYLRSPKKIKDKEEALGAYDRAFVAAVKKRIAGRKRVGIIFSGGIDSVLIAHTVKELKIPFTCYTAGMKDAVDVEWAEKIAEQLGFPLKVKTLTKDDIKKMIPEVIRDIEDYSLNQVEVSIPIYASMRMAQEAGERVVLTGQGADELFGGYPWYPTIVGREGYRSFEKYSWEDTFLLYKECLEREDKISMTHSIELRVPFLDPEVIRTAFAIDPSLKIYNGDDKLKKRIHREYCLFKGIPEEIAFREKEAAQHGANVHNVFTEIAEETGITESMLKKAGYDPDKSVLEKLGSSSRYGYRYGDEHLWKPLPRVQYYLDSVASQLRIFPEKVMKNFTEIACSLQN